MVLLAFSLQDQVEKYGAYVGIAAFFGLAALSLLYFAQAREVKRLREWAGRAPERAAEIEALAVAHAEEALSAPAASTPAPAAAPAPANGSVELKPAEVAALAFARAAGVHTPHPPRAHPVPVAAVAAGGPPPHRAGPPPAESEDATATAPATNGHGTGEVPPPATPAARRAEPPAPPPVAPPRRQPPPRRPVAQPARQESTTRAVVLTAVIGVLVLGGAAFGVTRLLAGNDSKARPTPPGVKTATAEPSAQATAAATPALTKQNVRVAVYNGTVQSGLAGSIRDQLVSQGYGQQNLGADTYTPDQQRQASVVMYQRSARAAAQEVARDLGIKNTQLIDSATQTLIQQSGKKWDVVVIVGADKSQ